jgi:hypothetical protein
VCVGVHRIVIFSIRPDTGFAGYQKKSGRIIRPDTGYFINFEYLTYNIYYKDFSYPCISAEGDTILIFE